MARFSDERLHRIVRNEVGRLAVWPNERDLPRGWQPTGVRGSYDECIRHIGSEDDPGPEHASPNM
ncbi:MbtH family protein [Rhizobium sp. S9]|nr:MbtH family protein [Rhizobium sp. S9]